MPGERFIVGTPDSLPDEDLGILGGTCQDITGKMIAAGDHYVPGPDSCTVCRCDGGSPKWCQAVLCAAPRDCKSFRIGSSCCEFICLDDVEGGRDEGSVDVSWDEGNWVSGDLGVRLLATAVTAIVSLALLVFLFYRLKRRRALRRSGCRDLEGDSNIPSNSLGSMDHGDLANSTGHLSRQPTALVNMGQHQSPICLIWKLSNTQETDTPPPYTESSMQRRNELEDNQNPHETTGLLATSVLPSAPPRQDLVEEPTIVLVRRSNGTLDSELLDAGTPPPSYAEVLASISTTSVDRLGEEHDSVVASGEDGDERTERRSSVRLSGDRTSHPDAVIQRFSLQLALDCSDTSSCTSSTVSHVRPLSTSSSSSAASLAHLDPN